MRIQSHKPGRGGNLLFASVLWLLAPNSGAAQTSSELKEILQRLERLEAANRSLTDEVRALRTQLAAVRTPQPEQPPVAEKVDVLESRVEEQAQSKVEASQRFPIRITGMALFNAFINSPNNGGAEYPTIATAGTERNSSAGFRQSVIGLDYRGPETLWGGKVHGALALDLFGGTGQTLDQLVRLRTASIGVDWKQRSFIAALEKPIFAPRDPTSLAQVGVSALTGAGNLWLWIPQVRFEQGFRFGRQAGLRAQIGMVGTREQSARTVGGYTPVVEKSRPGVEGRFAFHYGAERRIEIAPGFHASTSHVGGASVPSNLFSVDWFTNPWRPLEFTGTFFTGQNVGHLGTGGAGGGYNAFAPNVTLPMHARGGWGQLTYRFTPRFSINMFTGQHDNHRADLLPGQVGKNLSYGANVFYRFAPNVIGSLEASQVRTSRAGLGTILNNHYDLALAYIF
jgi:hypothetical protein